MMQAMIFAAGLGTRLKPLTDTMPKALVPVAGRPLLDHVTARLQQAGCTHAVVNVHHFADQIEQWLAEHPITGMPVSISDEREQLLETGGGLRHAAPLFLPDAPILIHNVDILSNVDLAAFYAMAGEADALLLVSERQTQRYLLFDDEMRLVGWTNTATGEVRSPYADLDPSRCQRFAFSGIHVLSTRLLQRMEEWPERFGIIDFYLRLCASADIRGVAWPGLKLLDVGKLYSLAEAERFVNERPEAEAEPPSE